MGRAVRHPDPDGYRHPVIFTETALPGAFMVDVDRREDERGFFGRTWCEREFREQGLNARLVQSSISFTKRRGTLRGLHYQAPPSQEDKLVRCTSGGIYDVVIDLRPGSPTRLSHVAAELTAENRRALFVPKGFAHGFQTLTDDAEVFYQMSEFYVPGAYRGVRWDDPAFGIRWPIANPFLNDRDATYPDFRDTDS